MESGRFQRLNSRRARSSDKASLVIFRRSTLSRVPRSAIAELYSLHFASLRRGCGNTFAARWDTAALQRRSGTKKTAAERDLDVAPSKNSALEWRSRIAGQQATVRPTGGWFQPEFIQLIESVLAGATRVLPKA